MNTSVFAIGRYAPQKKPLFLKKKQPIPASKNVSWRLLPISDLCPSHVAFCMDLLKGKTYLQKLFHLDKLNMEVKENTLFPQYRPSKENTENLLELKIHCKKAMLRNQRIRWILKHFLTQWRIRRFRIANDADPITLAVPEKPVKMVSFSSRTIYIFEANCFAKDIHKKLLNNDGQIPDPIYPRNPFTNEILTYSQLHSIYLQCKQYGFTYWTLEGFYDCDFSIESFLVLQRKTLRLHALHKILQDWNDWEGKEILMNFISTEHEHHELPCNDTLYKWSIQHIPEDPRIFQWRNLCRLYYEKDILLEDEYEKEQVFTHIHRNTLKHCNRPDDLALRKEFFLSTKKYGSSCSCDV